MKKLVAAGCIAACACALGAAKDFGKLSDGRKAKIWRIGSVDGLVVDVTAYGGRVVRVYAPDRNGNINVRKGPSIKSDVVAKIPDTGYDLPDPYDCLGKVNGWYKIKIDGKIGYVREDLVCWDAICTF